MVTTLQNKNKNEPFVDPNSGLEWIPLNITGQSFLLHQIRKMITMVIDVTRQSADMDVLHNSMQRKTKMRLSLAPAQGLVLGMSYFETYNRKKEVLSKMAAPLNWHNDAKDQRKLKGYLGAKHNH